MCVCVCLSVCLCVCVYVCVYAAFVDLRKTGWDRDVVFLIARNNTGHNLEEFYTNRITNSKMTDKMAAVKHYNWP